MTNFSTFDLSSTIAVDLGRHFVISLLLGFVLYFAYNRHFFRVITVALLVLFIDLDHFNPLTAIFGGVKVFHNLLFVTLVPAVCVGYFLVKAQKSHNYSGVFTSTLFFVMLSGHVFFDGMDSTPVLLFYPLNGDAMMISDMFLQMNVVSTMNLGMVTLLYFSALVLLVRQGILRIAEAENRSETSSKNWDTTQLFPVIDDITTGPAGTGSISSRMTSGIQICSTISRPRAANLF